MSDLELYDITLEGYACLLDTSGIYNPNSRQKHHIKLLAEHGLVRINEQPTPQFWWHHTYKGVEHIKDIMTKFAIDQVEIERKDHEPNIVINTIAQLVDIISQNNFEGTVIEYLDEYGINISIRSHNIYNFMAEGMNQVSAYRYVTPDSSTSYVINPMVMWAWRNRKLLYYSDDINPDIRFDHTYFNFIFDGASSNVDFKTNILYKSNTHATERNRKMLSVFYVLTENAKKHFNKFHKIRSGTAI